MFAKPANFLVYLVTAWLLSGRFLFSLVFATVIAVLAAVEYGWGTIQLFGVSLVLAVFLRITGLLPF